MSTISYEKSRRLRLNEYLKTKHPAAYTEAEYARLTKQTTIRRLFNISLETLFFLGLTINI